MSEDKKKSELVSTETFEALTNKQLETESAKLEQELKALDLELKRDQVSKIRAALNQKRDDARSRNIAIKQYMAQRDAQQANCNHLKGGVGADAFLRGQGDSPYYSVIKHRLPCNLFMVLCQRCGKEWHPAQKMFDIPETPGYQEAIRYNTNNTASGSSSFFFEKSVA